jgi:hypothetical protein
MLTSGIVGINLDYEEFMEDAYTRLGPSCDIDRAVKTFKVISVIIWPLLLAQILFNCLIMRRITMKIMLVVREKDEHTIQQDH